MITCNSCGELVQVGQAHCLRCGMPLFSDNQGETSLQKDSSGQSELPTWLESLRVNERPNSPASEQSYFSTSDLIDEEALPSWMRPENAEMMEKGNSGKYPAWRPASLSGPHTDEGNIQPKGFPASSLIDEQSLPSWVQGTTGAMPVTPDNQRNFSAASLIQPDDLPDWMKSLPQSSQGNSYTPDPTYHNSTPLPQSFSAQQLVDPQSITHFTPDQTGQQAGYFPGSTQPDERSSLSASSLFDASSLPTWLREEDQKQAFGSSQSGQISTGNSGFNGASLIDANAVPDWLRTYDAQEQQMGNVRPQPNGPAPRVENVRVPSRPRAEIVPHEQSEAAASVFSSVLGVASSAPYFPSAAAGTQWNVPPRDATLASQGFQSGQLPPPVGMPWNAPSQPSGIAGVQPIPGYNPALYQGGQQAVYPAGYQGAGGSSLGVPSGMAQQSPNVPGMQMGPSMAGQQSNTNASSSKPAKRGFLETIRSWFR